MKLLKSFKNSIVILLLCILISLCGCTENESGIEKTIQNEEFGTNAHMNRKSASIREGELPRVVIKLETKEINHEDDNTAESKNGIEARPNTNSTPDSSTMVLNGQMQSAIISDASETMPNSPASSPEPQPAEPLSDCESLHEDELPKI